MTRKQLPLSSSSSSAPVPKQALSVGELAARSGVSISAIHFYEKQQLIKSWRTDGNQRRFPRTVLRQLAIIKVAQRVGIPLSEIRTALAALPEGRHPTLRDWEKLSAHWQADLNARIQQLITLRDQLSGCIGCGCLSLSDCPLRNPHDFMAEQGPGAHVFDKPRRDNES